jgi:glycerol-3-phosphate dehydrogenase
MFDVCIIGAGGVVGCSIARELGLRGMTVVALEKHSGPGRETSGRNSRVIHSGFHETPGTLKAALAREGSQIIIRYSEERAIRLLRCGMFIAVPHGGIQAGLWREASTLWNLWKQGRRQKIPFQFVLSSGAARKLAPIEALGGIFIPSVCVIDLEGLMQSLAADAETAGAQFHFDSKVVGIRSGDSGYVVETSQREIQARILVNSAGLGAHEISTMAGGPNYEVEFLRGDYYELLGGMEKWGVRTLVYPAMPPGSRSKGVHFGPRTDGRLYIGPSASTNLEQAPKQLFLEAARKFIPAVGEADLQWAYAGTRPKNKSSCEKSDFIIRLDRTTPPLVNLIGIDSPGLSASMAIGRYVADKVSGFVGAGFMPAVKHR